MEVKGIGPALACDFFKEIGIERYGKPDPHIKRTFSKLKLIGEINQDVQTFMMLWHLADLTNNLPAVVDKILWIAASGRWDKTLDRELSERDRKEQQLHRKQGFDSLLEQLLIDS
jgi:thermostable 8-oxoguanine DNA glycosylase